MLQNPNFSGVWGSLQRSPDPLADGEGARCPFQEPHPALGPYRVGNPTNDRFQMQASVSSFFSVSENGENGLGDEGADGAMPPPPPECFGQNRPWLVDIRLAPVLTLSINSSNCVAAEVFLKRYMRYINPRFTYLLTQPIKATVQCTTYHTSLKGSYLVEIKNKQTKIQLIYNTRMCHFV